MRKIEAVVAMISILLCCPIGYESVQRDKQTRVLNVHSVEFDNYYEVSLSVSEERLCIWNREAYAEEFIENYRKDRLSNITFYDGRKPNSLYVAVYLSGTSNKKPAFAFRFVQKDLWEGYNLIDNPEKFDLMFVTIT